MVLPSYESILEAMTCTETPLNGMHHSSHFLPQLRRMEFGDKGIIVPVYFGWYVSPLSTHDVYVERNIENISKTILINISRKHSVIDNVLIRAKFSPKEIQMYTTLFK
jgi:hypothetical protein